MDFRILKEGGETNISNNDIMYMQYSNYFGLNAIGAGLDSDNNGVTIAGCQLQAIYTQADDTITASITDGYIIINGNQIKCESTASIQFPFTYFQGYRRMAYIYAEVVSTFNTLGDKIYVDLQQHQTWREDRIKLSYSFSSTPLAGTVLVGSCYVGGVQGSTPEPLIIEQIIPNISERSIQSTGNSDIVYSNRGGRDKEAVSVKALHSAINNWTIRQLTTATLNENYSFTFSLPAGYSNVYVLSAKAILYSNSNIEYGSISSSTFSWVVDKSLNTLTINFDNKDYGNYAQALVAIDFT
jgi:hypothetical protein